MIFKARETFIILMASRPFRREPQSLWNNTSASIKFSDPELAFLVQVAAELMPITLGIHSVGYANKGPRSPRVELLCEHGPLILTEGYKTHGDGRVLHTLYVYATHKTDTKPEWRYFEQLRNDIIERIDIAKEHLGIIDTLAWSWPGYDIRAT